MNRTVSTSFFVSLTLLLCAAQNNSPAAQSIFNKPDIRWSPGPASLPPGSEIALLEGDPSKEGPFTMRLRLPDGYRIPPHWHPKVEHITVVSGTFNLGMGEQFDQTATTPMAAGAFGFWPANMRHFVWAKGITEVQLHGIGPWGINYVNPSDDPRNRKLVGN